MHQLEMTRNVEQYSRNVEPVEGQIPVIRVPDFITVYVEQIDEDGRSIVFNEYKVDGKTYWAGYSSRSNQIFVSNG